MHMADEFDIIRTYFAPLATTPGALGLTDDAAIFAAQPGFEHVVTTDAIVQGVHFLDDETPANIAAKLVGSNLSDLASMGAIPVGFTLACAWPKATPDAFIKDFAASLKPWVEDYQFPLLGGDTVSTPGPLVFSLTAIGAVKTGTALTRGGAKPGDTVYVTGTIGDGALGLDAARGALEDLTQEDQAFLADRYRVPKPRVQAGQGLIGQAHAAIDISDGLIQDLGHIADVSGVHIEINADAVPLSSAAKSALALDHSLINRVLGGGDDYELAFTADAPPTGLDVPITAIGRVRAGTASVQVIKGGVPLKLQTLGFQHFA